MSTDVPVFQSFFRFLHHYELAELATSSIRVNKHSHCFDSIVSNTIFLLSLLVVNIRGVYCFPGEYIDHVQQLFLFDSGSHSTRNTNVIVSILAELPYVICFFMQFALCVRREERFHTGVSNWYIVVHVCRRSFKICDRPNPLSVSSSINCRLDRKYFCQ